MEMQENEKKSKVPLLCDDMKEGGIPLAFPGQ